MISNISPRGAWRGVFVLSALFWLIVAVCIYSIPAHAISAKYRAKLERSGCTQVTDANGSCDVNKTKAQNAKKK